MALHDPTLAQALSAAPSTRNAFTTSLQAGDGWRGCTPSAGDLSYYAPSGNLAILHRGFAYSSGLIRLGHLETGLDAMRKAGSLTVVLTRDLP